jgi:hypothetical protein
MVFGGVGHLMGMTIRYGMYRTGIYTVQAKYEILGAVITNYNGDAHPKSLFESPPQGCVAEVYSVSHLLKVN